jgi:hypothetical protein
MGEGGPRKAEPGEGTFLDMETTELAKALVALGCPPEKSAEMAVQLDKRARQLAAQKGRTYEEALQHLLGLMRQGWAVQDRNS